MLFFHGLQPNSCILLKPQQCHLYLAAWVYHAWQAKIQFTCIQGGLQHWSILYIFILVLGLRKFDVGRKSAAVVLNYLLCKCLCGTLRLLYHFLDMNLQPLQTMLSSLHFGSIGCYASNLCSTSIDNLHYLLHYILQCRLHPTNLSGYHWYTGYQPLHLLGVFLNLLNPLAYNLCDALLNAHTYKGIVENFIILAS